MLSKNKKYDSIDFKGKLFFDNVILIQMEIFKVLVEYFNLIVNNDVKWFGLGRCLNIFIIIKEESSIRSLY